MINKFPSVILLGGSSNALALARSFSKRGIRVYCLNFPNNIVRYSRYCTTFTFNGNKNLIEKQWLDFLLDKKSNFLHNSVIFSCCDEGIETVVKNYNLLSKNYILENYNLHIQSQLLDKLSTYKLAKDAGIPTPEFWEIDSQNDINNLLEKIDKFPLLVKPRISHHFRRYFNRKFFLANNKDELSYYLKKIKELNLEVILMELIPGPDSNSGSYYTYIDKHGNFLFHYTKKQLRRYPVNMGPATYHITTKDSEVIKLGSMFFEKINFRGIGNIEFKRDPRDGKYKLIECNARFTEGTKLVIKSGIEIGLIAYYDLIGENKNKAPDNYKNHVRLWDPSGDFRAFLELRNRNELTTIGWIKSILHKQSFPYFSFDDPMPSVVYRLNTITRRLKRFL